MTATLAPPPPNLAMGPSGSRAANHAIARWARRLLRREWRQQLLVLSLLTLAVAATTVGLGLVTNIQSSDQSYLGFATTRVDITSPTDVGALIAQARAQLGAVEAIEDAAIPIPGATETVDLRAIAQNGRFSSPMVHIVSGHYPGAGEIAVTRSVQQTFGLHVGQVWQVLGEARRVVGIVENPKDLGDAFALVAPGQIASPGSVSFLTDAPFGSGSATFRPVNGQLVGIMSNGQSAAQRRQQQALAVLLLSTIGLTFIGLLSVAGFTVMAQRRLRSLGMIAAIGATDRQVRKVMLANGTAVGVVGAAAGVVIGLVAWVSLRPAFENVVGHRIDPFSLPWWAEILGAVLAVLASIAASWWPARSVARMPVVAALSGRPPAPKPAHRFALAGLLLAAVGVVLLTHNSNSTLVVLGIVLTTGGMLLLAPLGIQGIALFAGRAPVAVRLALRDLARFQARSGAALAAVGLAIGISATIAVTAAAQQSHDLSYTVGNLPTNQLIVWLNGSPGSGGGGKAIAVPGEVGANGPTPQQIAGARSAAASIAKELGAGSPVELDNLVNPNASTQGAGPGAGVATLVRPIVANGHSGFSFVDQPYLATPALLALYGIAPGDIHGQVITSRPDLVGAKMFDGLRDSLYTVQTQVVSRMSKYTSAPDAMVTEAEAAALGVQPTAIGFLVQAHSAVTPAQISAARHTAASASVTVETRNAPDNSLSRLREYSTLVGILVALGVLAMTVGLIRSETAGDLRTLTAAGAGGMTRRMLTATTAAALALLGGIIGVAGAYLAQIAWHWHHVDYLDKPPYVELACLVVVLPIAALAGGWLFGRTPTHLARVRSE